MTWMPLHIRVHRPVLVVGAGPVGRRRAAWVREAGAPLRWVAPDAPLGGVGEIHQRPWRAADLEGCGLAFACGPAPVNAAVVAAARAAGVLVGRADAPEQGDVLVPARVRRGALSIGLSTGGVAPAASRALRRALEARVPEAWGAFVARLAEARRARAPGEARRRWLQRVADGPLLGLLESGDQAAAEAWLAQSDQSEDA